MRVLQLVANSFVFLDSTQLLEELVELVASAFFIGNLTEYAPVIVYYITSIDRELRECEELSVRC